MRRTFRTPLIGKSHVIYRLSGQKSEEEITYNKSDSEVLFLPFYRVKVILPFKKIQN